MEDNSHKKVLGLVGPTGVGKTALAIELCRKLEGEIISCDSRQIYRGLNIGTAKPSPEERALVRHYLIDVAEIGEFFSAHRYRALAQSAIEAVFAQGKQPLIVGGSGLYYRALTEGFFEVPDYDPDLRAALEDEAEEYGPEYLWKKLEQVDPIAAGKISHSDRFRLIRALEIFHSSGRTKSELSVLGKYPEKKFYFVTFGLNLPRGELYARINRRVERMLAEGWQKETEELIAGLCINSRNKRKLMGYNYLYDFLEGRMEYRECVEKIKQAHRNYAKRQLTWFRKTKIIRWFSARDPQAAEKIVELFCQQ